MVSLDMQSLFHWLVAKETILAITVTVGVALFLFCCLECSNCSCREKDDLFRRHNV